MNTEASPKSNTRRTIIGAILFPAGLVLALISPAWGVGPAVAIACVGLTLLGFAFLDHWLGEKQPDWPALAGAVFCGLSFLGAAFSLWSGLEHWVKWLGIVPFGLLGLVMTVGLVWVLVEPDDETSGSANRERFARKRQRPRQQPEERSDAWLRSPADQAAHDNWEANAAAKKSSFERTYSCPRCGKTIKATYDDDGCYGCGWEPTHN